MIEDLKEQLDVYYNALIALIPRLFIAVIIVTIILIALGAARKKLKKVMSVKADDQLLVGFIDNIFRIINISIGILLFLYIIGQAGLASSVLGAATLSSVVIGFAFKDIAENFLAGVIMAFNRPFRLGDTIKTGDVEGNIIEMSLRDTHVKTFDGKDVYVPNGQIIKNPLFNYTIDGYLRGNFTVGVDYGSDIKQVRSIIQSAVEKVPGVLKDDKPPRTHVKNLNTSTVDIEVHYWIDTFNKQYSGLEVKSQAQSQIVKELTKAKVGMPADIVELKKYDEDGTLPATDELLKA